MLCVVLVADLSPITHLGVAARLNRGSNKTSICVRGRLFSCGQQELSQSLAQTHTHTNSTINKARQQQQQKILAQIQPLIEATQANRHQPTFVRLRRR